jgi:hypothetical protein
MKKIVTALKLFSDKMPNLEIRGIEQLFANHFKLVTAAGVEYNVNIANNSVGLYYGDPDY